MVEFVFPAEPAYHRHEADPGDHTVPPTVEEGSGSRLRLKESSAYSWNLAASLI